MHGLINRALQCFIVDTAGPAAWEAIVTRADLGFHEFEAMLHYDDALTYEVLAIAASILGKPDAALLEDLGTYLVSHPNVEALRRLLRFGGVSYVEFLHSLDDLPDRARMAVPDLDLPDLELHDCEPGNYMLVCRAPHRGFGTVLVGVLRAMADDYGALALVEMREARPGTETVSISLLATEFAQGRRFDLALPRHEDLP